MKQRKLKKYCEDETILNCSSCKADDAKYRCSRCKVTYYCSVQHQKEDWACHKKECNIQLTEKRLVDFFRLGKRYMKEKKYEISRLFFTKVLELRPKHIQSISRRGKVSYRMGDYTTSIRDFSRVIEESPNFDIFYNRGLTFFKLGKLKDSISDFGKAIALKPNDYRGYSERGMVYCSLQEHQLAIQDFDNSIRLNPNEYMTFYHRGNAHMELKDHLRFALNDFNKAIFFHQYDYNVFNNRGIVHSQMGNYEKSLRDYNKALKLFSEDHCVFFNRGKIFYMMGKYKMAISDYSKVIEMKPEEHRGYFNRGNAYVQIGRLEEAIDDFNDAIRVSPDSSSTLFISRAETFVEMKRFEDAIDDLSVSMNMNPMDSILPFRRGRVYLKMEEFEKSIIDFKQFRDMTETENSVFLFNIGVLLDWISEAYHREKWFLEQLKQQQRQFSNFKFENLCQKKFGTLMRCDISNSLEMYCQIIQMIFKNELCVRVENNEKLHSDETENEVKVIVDEKGIELETRMKKLTNQWFPFFKPQNQNNNNIHEKNNGKYRFLGDRLKEKDVKEVFFGKKFSDLTVYKFIGETAFARDYLVRIFDDFDSGEFILRILKPDFNEDEKETIRDEKKDDNRKNYSLLIPFHRNVSSIFVKKDERMKIDLKKLPDFNDYWIRNVEEEKQKESESYNYRCQVIFMEYHRKTLWEYINQRKEQHYNLEILEICYVLKGLLEGMKHLHDNKIVHNCCITGGIDDIFTSVFVDEIYGEIYLGDFSKSLDFRNESEFIVRKDQELMFNIFTGKTFRNELLKVSMEERDAETKEEEEDKNSMIFEDYEKNDLYTVGVIGYFFFSDSIHPYGSENEYIELENCKCSKLSFLIRNLLKINVRDRIGFNEASQEISNIIQFWESGEEIFENEGW